MSHHTASHRSDGGLVRDPNALQRAKAFIAAQRGRIAPLPISEEELNPDVQDDLSVQAYPLEDATRAYRVDYRYPDDAPRSEFQYFEDGRQRTIQIGHIPTEIGMNQLMIPVHFFVVASVILQRDRGQLSVWDRPIVRQGIFLPRSLIPNQWVLEEFIDAGLDVVDTEERSAGTGDYYDMRRRALREAKRLRLTVEQQLITRWRQDPQSAGRFLVVDGTLMNMRDEKSVDRCIGVSKSFGSRYFDSSTHSRVLCLGEFERSWTFQFHDQESDARDLRKGSRERISWYLRLRQSANCDPEFGLVRVEISQRHQDEAPALADRFSRSLISERLPTSYPAPRWDKHLYPIRACEAYLASIIPSIATITASMRA
jgi:hypothetical protein